MRAIFEWFHGILHEDEIEKRVQYTIEGLFGSSLKGSLWRAAMTHDRHHYGEVCLEWLPYADLTTLPLVGIDGSN